MSSDPHAASNSDSNATSIKSKSSPSPAKSVQQCPSQYNPTLRNSDTVPKNTNTGEEFFQQHHPHINSVTSLLQDERYSSNVTEGSATLEDNSSMDINEFEYLLEKYKPRGMSLSLREKFQIPKEYLFAAIGGKQVGKTSIISHSIMDEFPEETNLNLEESHVLSLTASSQQYIITLIDSCGDNISNESLDPNITIGVEGYALIFDITSEKSFQIMKELHLKLLDVLMATVTYGTMEIPRLVIGNMNDKIEKREIRKEDAIEYAASWGIPYFEISAFEKLQCILVWTVLLAQVEENEEIRCDPERSHKILKAQQDALRKRKEKKLSEDNSRKAAYETEKLNLSRGFSTLSLKPFDE